MRIKFDMDEERNEVIITLSDLEMRDLKNLNKFLDDPSNILLGITDDAILILLEKNIKSLWRSFNSSKYDLLYISDLGTFLINQKGLKKEFNEDMDSEGYMVKIETRDGDEE
jgi:hypothetical protein